MLYWVMLRYATPGHSDGVPVSNQELENNIRHIWGYKVGVKVAGSLFGQKWPNDIGYLRQSGPPTPRPSFL